MMFVRKTRAFYVDEIDSWLTIDAVFTSIEALEKIFNKFSISIFTSDFFLPGSSIVYLSDGKQFTFNWQQSSECIDKSKIVI